MSAARKVGMALGRGVGVVAATTWKGTVIVAGAAGEAGEGFVQGAGSGWDDRCVVMDAAIAARAAKRDLAIAAFKATREAKTTLVATA